MQLRILKVLSADDDENELKTEEIHQLQRQVKFFAEVLSMLARMDGTNNEPWDWIRIEGTGVGLDTITINEKGK